MRVLFLVVTILLGTMSLSMAQSSGGGGGSGGASSSGGAGATGSGGGSTLSNGTTLSGTGGSPGPNSLNAKGQGTTGQRLGIAPSTQESGGSRPNYNSPAANAAVQQLGNTNTGILKK
jgi:hypothetical protein